VSTTAVRPRLRPAPDQRRAVLALARVEAGRLARHPITVLAGLMLAGIWVSQWFTNEANRFPVLQDADRDTQLGTMLLLGGAALIAGNLAVLRAHRHGTVAVDDLLVLPAAHRTAAHLLAVLPIGLIAAVLTSVRIGLLALAPAAGRPDPFELATGPVAVLLLGAAGVLCGRLTRSAVVAPLVLLGILALLVVIPLLSGGGGARWFQPVRPEGESGFVLPAPAYLMARPAGAHLAYLTGLAVLAAVAALTRSGSRSVGVRIAALAALAVAVAGGIAQTTPPGAAVDRARDEAMRHPARAQVCQRLDPVTYCAFGDFTAWIPYWDAQVRAVLRRVPTAAAGPGLAVRQRIVVEGPGGGGEPMADWRADDLAAGTPNAVSVGTRWGDSRTAATLAGLVAYRLVTGERPDGATTVCGGRAVVIGWLAGQADARSRTGLRLLAAQGGPDGGGVFFPEAGAGSGVALPHREVALAQALLDRPVDEVGATVRASWTELTAERTSAERAAGILGVPVPAQASTEDCR